MHYVCASTFSAVLTPSRQQGFLTADAPDDFLLPGDRPTHTDQAALLPLPPAAGCAAEWSSAQPPHACERAAAAAADYAAAAGGFLREYLVPTRGMRCGVYRGCNGAAIPGPRDPPYWRGPTAPGHGFVEGGETAGIERVAAASVEELAAAAARVPTSATTLRLMRECRRASRRSHGSVGDAPPA